MNNPVKGNSNKKIIALVILALLVSFIIGFTVMSTGGGSGIGHSHDDAEHGHSHD